MSNYIFVDVEALGTSPVNGTMTEFGAVHGTSKETFHGVLFNGTPDPDNPAVPVVGDRVATDEEVARAFLVWLQKVCKNDRPVFVSDNVAYDWMWIAGMFDRSGLGGNPFGHSGRRIGDFWAGLNNNFGETQSWKRFRQTKHDHNPVNDAMGNVEAFEKIKEVAKKQREQTKQNAKSGQNPGVLFYSVPEEEYDRLVEDSATLNALEIAGVDNWDGYSYAMTEVKESLA